MLNCWYPVPLIVPLINSATGYNPPMRANTASVLLAVSALALCVPARLLGQIPTALELEQALQSVDEEAPPVYEVEFLVFAYNEFNPLEEEFPPAKPKWSKSPADYRITARPETLEPSSADWYLDSLTLPVTSDNPLDPTTDTALIPGVYPGADPAAGYDPGQATSQPLDSPIDNTDNGVGTPPETVEEPTTWYQFLDPERFELGRALARLGTLDAYTPLLHGGWSQAALLEDEAIPLELGLFGRLKPAGSIRLHRSRFLHLTIDVSIQDDYRYRPAPIAPGATSPLTEFVGPTKYVIQTQRRIRSGELHFFDHPAFGILVIVRPAPEEPEPEEGVTEGPAA